MLSLSQAASGEEKTEISGGVDCQFCSNACSSLVLRIASPAELEGIDCAGFLTISTVRGRIYPPTGNLLPVRSNRLDAPERNFFARETVSWETTIRIPHGKSFLELKYVIPVIEFNAKTRSG